MGAGISGISTAYFLNKQGYDVTVVDAKSDVAQGATAVATPLLPTAAESIVGFNIFRKVKSSYCPIKFLKGETQIGDKYSISTLTNAFGFNFLQTLFDTNAVPTTQKLSRLAATNQALVLSMVGDLKLDVPFNFGFLRIGDDRGKMKEILSTHKLLSSIVDNYDAVRVESGDVSRMFPPAQNKSFDLFGGVFEPSTAVMSPVDLTRELARVCKERGVQFVMNTQVRGLTLDASGEKVTHLETNNGSMPVDNLVLCSGYSSYALTDSLTPNGALAPLIPVRSLTVNIDDSTPNTTPLPTLFPTKPLTWLPKVIANAEDYKNAPAPDDIVAGATLPSGTQAKFHPAAVEFSKVNVLIASDARNPRRAKAYTGKSSVMGVLIDVAPGLSILGGMEDYVWKHVTTDLCESSVIPVFRVRPHTISLCSFLSSQVVICANSLTRCPSTTTAPCSIS